MTLAALALDPADSRMRAWFVAAFVLCLVGDVALMLPQDLFVLGLGAFLVAHVLFVVGFIVAGGLKWLPFAVGVAVVLAGTAMVGRAILAGATRIGSPPSLAGGRLPAGHLGDGGGCVRPRRNLGGDRCARVRTCPTP